MQRLGRFVFGFRDDIDLNQRWWHRLLKVVAALFAIGLAIFLVSDAAVKQPERSKLSDVRITGNLGEYVLAHGDENGTVEDVSDFTRWTFIGQTDGQTIKRFNDFLLISTKCGRLDLIPTGKKEVTPIPLCTGIDDATKVVQYELDGTGKAKAWISASMWTAGYMAVTALAVLNVYYRGLVFIIAGPRRKQSETAAV